MEPTNILQLPSRSKKEQIWMWNHVESISIFIVSSRKQHNTSNANDCNCNSRGIYDGVPKPPNGLKRFRSSGCTSTYTLAPWNPRNSRATSSVPASWSGVNARSWPCPPATVARASISRRSTATAPAELAACNAVVALRNPANAKS